MSADDGGNTYCWETGVRSSCKERTVAGVHLLLLSVVLLITVVLSKNVKTPCEPLNSL